jgi:hypothetical protein
MFAIALLDEPLWLALAGGPQAPARPGSAAPHSSLEGRGLPRWARQVHRRGDSR